MHDAAGMSRLASDPFLSLPSIGADGMPRYFRSQVPHRGLSSSFSLHLLLHAMHASAHVIVPHWSACAWQAS